MQFAATQIIIQSPYLCKELGPAFEKHGLELFDDSIEINRPFAALFFERDLVYRLSKTVEDQDTKDHLRLLCKVIDEELGHTIDLAEALQREKKTTFKLMWALFPPGTLAVAKEHGYYQGYRVIGSSTHDRPTDVLDEDYSRRAPYHPPPPPPPADFDYPVTQVRRRAPVRRLRVRERRDSSPGGGEYLNIECQFVQFNGSRYGHGTRNFKIAPFEGKMNVTDLDLYPYSVDDDNGNLRDTLVKRGERVLRFQDVHYMQYNGLAIQSIKTTHHREVGYSHWNQEVSCATGRNISCLISASTDPR